MGKYNVGYHGPAAVRNLEGIATLTQDPIAIENLLRKRENICKEVAKVIEEAKRQILEVTGIPKEAFDK